jgi:uncharacterized protein YwlG (UPF0340 family)
MDTADETLEAGLEAIRDMASNALNQIGSSQEERSMRWRCKACQHVNKACAVGSRWQMPSMQKHRIQTYAMRNSLMA